MKTPSYEDISIIQRGMIISSHTCLGQEEFVSTRKLLKSAPTNQLALDQLPLNQVPMRSFFLLLGV